MRKILYSSTLKFLAVVLLIACVAGGVLVAAHGVLNYFDQDVDLYDFEEDFSKAKCLSLWLEEPENVMFNAYRSTFLQLEDQTASDNSVENGSTEKAEKLEANIRKWFEEFENSDKINYYVQWNDVVLTNCGAKSAEELSHGEYYSYLKRDASGVIKRESSQEFIRTREYLMNEIEWYDASSTIIISCNIKEDVIAEYRAIWEKQETIVIDTAAKAMVCTVVGLLMLIYLICVCGKNKDGEYKNIWLDNIWVEVHLATIAGASAGVAFLMWFVLDRFESGHFPQPLIYWILGGASTFGGLIVITSLLSIIRNIKTCRLVSTSIILCILRWILRLLNKMVKWFWKRVKAGWRLLLGLLSKKAGVILITMMFVYTMVIVILTVCAVISPIGWLLGVLAFGFACFVVAYRARDFDEIKKGASEVRNGNVGYKIPKLKCDDMRILAENINDIAIGLDQSVAAKVKAERMKSELITNVSHDLKTPITSIISYTELLSKVYGLPDEARDYVAVISKKSDRLKKLTQDLFDISKVQSGNEDVFLEKLNVALLLNQALGEHDNEIQSSGLSFCVEAPKELYISADGRKMSRVLSNLINNILKYTMKNTRVFITASEKGGMIEVEFKNISAYPLNFSAEEITQRFVRGDESRTAEGNGLGLAIAKGYTEICNGTFDVVVDGDLFKAILKFKKYI